MTAAVSCTHEDGLAIIELGRPEARNALNVEMLQRLAEALDEAAWNDRTSVIVLLGDGPSFCSGDDLRDERLMAGAREDRLELLRSLHVSILRVLLTGPKLSVVGLRGYAVGFGCDLALACDFRVVASNAVLRDARLEKGITSATGATWLAPHLVGHAKAADLLIGGATWERADLEALGLANRIVDDPEDVPAAARACGADLATSHADMRARARTAMWQSRHLPMDAGLATAIELIDP